MTQIVSAQRSNALLTNPLMLPMHSGTDVIVLSLPLTGQGTDNAIYTSEYYRGGGASTRGAQILTSHTYGKRHRHSFRVNYIDRDSSDATVVDTSSIYFVVDRSPSPTYGSSALLAGLGWMLTGGLATAVSGSTDVTALHASVASFLTGES